MSDLLPFPLRVAVGSPDGPRSGAWRFWLNKSDVYCGVRALASMFKISLHEGGQCNSAFTSEFAERLGGEANLPKGTRRRDTWRRDTNVQGVTLPLEVVFPTCFLGPVRESSEDTTPIHYLPPPGPDEAVILLPAFGTRQPDLETWPLRPAGTRQLAAESLPNGETFWLLYVVAPFSPKVKAAALDQVRRMRHEEPTWANGELDLTKDSMRAVLSGDGADGRRLFLDTSLAIDAA